MLLYIGHFAKCTRNTWKILKFGAVIEISWTNRVENEILHRVTVERNILHTVHRMKASWIGHFLPRKCLLRHVIKGKMERRIEVKERQVRRRKQVLDDF